MAIVDKYVEIESTDIELIDGDRGKNYPHQNELLQEGACVFLSASNVTSDGFKFNSVVYITAEKDRSLRNGKIQRGDIVITTRGTVGNVAYYDRRVPYENVRINSGMLIIRCHEQIKSEFLYYVLRGAGFQQQIKLIQTGTAQPQLPKSHFKKMKIIVPTIAVQEKIAKVFRTIDEKIENNQHINKNLEQQALALYHHMFVKNISPNWKEGTLKDIADITMGQSPSGNSYNEDGKGTIFFQGRAEFGFRFPSIRLYTTEPKRMAYANDALMSVRAPVGDLNVAYTDCCIGRGLAAIHSKTGHQSFVLYTMFALKEQLNIFNGEGTVFGSINRKSLNDMPVVIPTPASITAFESVVAPIDNAIRNNHDEISHLTQIRDSLLPKLMSGEIDVSELDI